jgi:hypothetical protein
MTTYVLDIKQENRKHPNNYTDIVYHFQIDINGNVCIKIGSKDGYYRDCDCITINDNIPISSYLIKSIELLIKGSGGTPLSNFLYQQHFELVKDTIVSIKTSLKEITGNPKENLDFTPLKI